jgi:glycosyltransferase involved in cell wall biosynthesis/GT2 family glycosyltransferase
MRVSVIVPTYKRPESLLRCLDALVRQDTQPDEIVVVTRRDDDASRRRISERRAKSIRLVLIDIPAGYPGLVAALNAGVEASRGEIVCLTDDDAEPRPDWISRMLAAFCHDPSIAAVGGRDWIYQDGQLIAGAAARVGVLTRWGRVIGNHHLGVGPPRDVAVLKGVNLGVRGDLLREVRFDTRLRGLATEHHSELGLCLILRRMGYRTVYDPSIAVDHRPQPRVAESRELSPKGVRDAAHNETLALLEYLPPLRQAKHLLWATMVGTRGAPGFVQAIRLLLTTRDHKVNIFVSNLVGRGLAISTYLRRTDGVRDAISASRGRSARARHAPIPRPRATSRGKPRIALVAHDVHDSGGMERVCAELIRRRAREFDFIVISATLAPDLRALVTDWLQVRVPQRPFPLKLAAFWVRAGWRARFLDADIIHTVGAIIPNRVDVAAIHFCHAGFVAKRRRLVPPGTPLIRRANRSLGQLLALAAERWCYRPGRVRAFAAVSEGVRGELLRHYPGIEVSVTPNGVDLDRFHPNPRIRSGMRQGRGLSDEPLAVFVGGDWTHKGLALSIQALAGVQARGRDLHLWVIGAGDQSRFSALAQKLGVASVVSFFGTRDDVESFLAAADIFILPSQYEAFSLVTLEAAASGLPVIMPALNGASEVVGDNEAGLLVETTAESVGAALARLVDDTDLRNRLGRQARKRATRYGWEPSIEAVSRLYFSLLREETIGRPG